MPHERGKGQARRKKVVRRKNISQRRLSPIEKDMQQCINRVNELIRRIDMDHDDTREDPYDKFFIYLQDHIVTPYMMDMYRDCFIKKEYWNKLRQVRKCDENENENDDDSESLWDMWASYFWDDAREEMRMPTNLHMTFTQDPGMCELSDICDMVERCLNKKEYMQSLSDSDDESERVDIAAFHDMFEIDDTEKPTRDYLVRKYRRLSLQYHPDRHPAEEREEWATRFKELCFAYKWLLARYCD